MSNGIEPAFAAGYSRNVLDPSGDVRAFELTDRAVASWRRTRLPSQSRLLPAFRLAAELSPREHLLMQAALQPLVDNAISKTINVAEETSFEDFRGVYDMAFDLGLKGCTTFRASRELRY